MAGDAIEKHNIGDAVTGKGSPFSAHSLLKGFLGSGGGGETGGGMGDKFNAPLAQAHLDEGMKENIYKSAFA